MAEAKSEKKVNKKRINNLIKDYPVLHANIYNNLNKSVMEFFQKDLQIRFMSITKDENILFFGDEYFVNKIPVNSLSDIKIKISSNAVKALLDLTLGESDSKFNLNSLTYIEAELIKSFTLYFYKSIEDYLDKTELNKRIIQSAVDYDFTFYIKSGNTHLGKIIVTIPEYLIPYIEEVSPVDRFTINDFKKIGVNLNIAAGESKLSLNDIKSIESGDVILLENSNINEMAILWRKERIPFKINPNPSLIISIEKDGGKEMEQEAGSKSQNMWDSILVDIVAEFDNVKLTLGELKQISEGLVIDVGSIYNNKIKLRVENQIIATGELVILNDRYGVRVDNVVKSSEKKKLKDQPSQPAQQNEAPPEKENGDENFDYSDFNIEDESI